MRTFKTRAFTRFAHKADLSDAVLCQAVRDAERGVIAADLGGGVIKQRIARQGQGKSGGFRTLIVFRSGSRAVFVHGFAKNERENVTWTELTALRRLSGELQSYDDRQLAQAIASGALVEINCNEEAVQ